jgi:hypothetical protein
MCRAKHLNTISLVLLEPISFFWDQRRTEKVYRCSHGHPMVMYEVCCDLKHNRLFSRSSLLTAAIAISRPGFTSQLDYVTYERHAIPSNGQKETLETDFYRKARTNYAMWRINECFSSVVFGTRLYQPASTRTPSTVHSKTQMRTS